MGKIKQLFSLCEVILLLSVSTTVYSQNEVLVLPIDSVTNKILYSEIVYVDSSYSTQEIFSEIREWFALAYKSSTDVLQMEDKMSGKIIGKATMQIYNKILGSKSPGGYIDYTISILIKEDRFKYEITNFRHDHYGVCEKMINSTEKTMGISHQKTYDYFLSQMDKNIKALIFDLKETVNKSKNRIKRDDW